MDHAYDDDEKCRSCGKSYAMHGMVTDLCPGAGENTWVNTMFERLPARPTGPTLEFVRELEAEAVKVKAERIIIEAQGGISIQDAIVYALAVIDLGRISDDGKAHCYVSRFQDGTVVYAKKNKASDSFFVRGTGEGGE